MSACYQNVVEVLSGKMQIKRRIGPGRCLGTRNRELINERRVFYLITGLAIPDRRFGMQVAVKQAQ